MATCNARGETPAFFRKATVIWSRQPASAARHAAALFAPIVGERPENVWLKKKGNRRVQLLRHLVVHLMREELGYLQHQIAAAMERHHSTVANSHLVAWRMREDDRVDALIVRVRAMFRERASSHLAELATRGLAFDRHYRAIQAAKKRLDDDDLADCLAAAAEALPIENLMLREERPVADQAPAPELIEAHPAEAILAHAPAIRRAIGVPAFSAAPTRAGGIRLELVANTVKDRMQRALEAAAQILGASGFTATPEGVFQVPQQQGAPQSWRAVLRVAPAPMMGIAAALGLLMQGGLMPPQAQCAIALEAA